MNIRSDQRSQKSAEVVQPRPTCAEKVRRIFPLNINLLSNRPTSSNLPHAPARTPARICARARTPVYVFTPRQVRRLDSELIRQQKNRPTLKNRLDELGEVGR